MSLVEYTKKIRSRVGSQLRIVELMVSGVGLCLITASSTAAGAVISQRLDTLMHNLPDTARIKVWVYVSDKVVSPEILFKTSERFTQKARLRRQGIPFDRYDIAVTSAYLDSIAAVGGETVGVSRWLNAVSVRLTRSELEEISGFTFVQRIEPVATAYRIPYPEEYLLKKAPGPDSSGYGLSFTQNHMLGTDSLHRLGFSGQGVLIAFFDTGYMITHFAFDSTRILDTWDFINNKPTVDDEVGAGQTDHGTATFSVCGGYALDSLIGAAYGANFLLAKTEILSTEIQAEEDYWVMAAEWADSLGVDIISSSLGYSQWYTYADMNGKTAVTSIAAAIAASRGILVVNSAGNQGASSWRYITAPADADSMLAVGAISSLSEIAAFSSFGPTYDGRTKPDVVAMGVGTRCASYAGGFTYKSGTSLSTPLIAGGAALVLQTNPSLRGHPHDIRARIIESADRFTQPDNHYGYGLPDMVTAAGFELKIHPVGPLVLEAGHDTTVLIRTLAPLSASVLISAVDLPSSAEFTDNSDGTANLRLVGSADLAGFHACRIAAIAGTYRDTLEFSLTVNPGEELFLYGPNPFTDSLTITAAVNFPDGFKVEVFTLSGELIYQEFESGWRHVWRAVNQSDRKVASGTYIVRISADAVVRKVKVLRI